MLTPRLAAAALAVAAGFALLVVLLVPNPGSRAHAATVATVAPAALTPQQADGSADEAFLADLFDGQATEVSAQQRDDLVAIGHRICDLGQPRADWTASLVDGGYTPSEAGKILDTAEAAYCPTRLAEARS